ncbi:MAG: hypothetical protein GF330_08780 [Candidatus Eisenbacteria bacterium]|nr:hypothetical protein [Candidatus Eisenbacteria bacterium]
MRAVLLPLISLLCTLWWPAPLAWAGRDLDDGFVGCSYSDDAYAFDLETFDVGPSIDLLPEGNYPYDAVMSFDGAEVWICGASGDGVVVIDRHTNTVSHRIPVGEYLVGLCFGQDGSFVLASSRDEDRIYRISTETYAVLDFIQLTEQPGNLALDPVSGRIYAVEWYGERLYEISSDGTAVLRSAPIGGSLWQLVVDPAGQFVYVTDRSYDRVHVVDPLTLEMVAAPAVGDDPWGLDVNADGSRLVCTCEDNSAVYLITFGSWYTYMLPLGSTPDPRDVDILDSRDLAYVCGGDTGSPDLIFVIDIPGEEIFESFAIPGGSNTNVIAVQPQMGGGSGGVSNGGPDRLRISLATRPNPLTAAGWVRFHLAEAEEIELSLHDLAGRHLATLRDGLHAAGAHRMPWSWSELEPALPSGAYWLRLRARGQLTSTRVLKLE